MRNIEEETTIQERSDEALRRILLTANGQGAGVKARALEELLARAREDARNAALLARGAPLDTLEGIEPGDVLECVHTDSMWAVGECCTVSRRRGPGVMFTSGVGTLRPRWWRKVASAEPLTTTERSKYHFGGLTEMVEPEEPLTTTER